MLQLIEQSRNKKTGDIAQTYRTGPGALFSSCPATCPLNPTGQGASTVDRSYLKALIEAVPRRGKAWTYTHFPVGKWGKVWREAKGPKTVINFSADSMAQAKRVVRQGIPVTLAAPAADVKRVQRVNGVRYVQCPATYLDHVNCANCGGDTPLCARERDYVIVFPAHGATAKRVGAPERGGCYAAGGNVGFHWRKLMKRATDTDDATTLREWVEDLPRRSLLRHHVAGDIGRIEP